MDAVGLVDTIEDVHERSFDVFLDALYVAMLEPERLSEALRGFAGLFRAEDAAICLAKSAGQRAEAQLVLSTSGHGKNGDSAKSLAITVKQQLLSALDRSGRALPAEVTRGQVVAGAKAGHVNYL